MSWVLEVRQTPSGNVTKRWLAGGQWYRYSRLREAYSEVLAELRMAHGVRVERVPVRRVVIERHSAGELDGADNVSGGAKPLLDALVDAGWLVDDSNEWLVCEYRQVKCKPRAGKTIVRIEDVPGSKTGEGGRGKGRARGPRDPRKGQGALPAGRNKHAVGHRASVVRVARYRRE